MAARTSTVQLRLQLLTEGLRELVSAVDQYERLDDATNDVTPEIRRLAQQFQSLTASQAQAAGGAGRLASNQRSVERQSRQTTAAMREQRNALERLVRQTSATTVAGQALRRVFAGLSAVLVLNEFGRVNDELARNERILTNVAGSAELAAAELDNLIELSDRLGLNLGGATDQFVKFAASTKGTAIDAATTKQIFEDTAAALAGLGANSALAEQAFRALTQIAAKGRVSLEELNGQLGDAIPGSSRIAAEALGLTQAELFKLVESGDLLASDLLPGLARGLKNTFGAGDAKRVETYGAALNRLQNGFTRILQAIGNTGAYKAFVSVIDFSAKAVNELADLLGGVDRKSDQPTRQAADNVKRIKSAAEDSGKAVDDLDESIKKLGDKPAKADSLAELAKEAESLQLKLSAAANELARLRELERESAGGDDFGSIAGISGYGAAIDELNGKIADYRTRLSEVSQQLEEGYDPALKRAREEQERYTTALEAATPAQRQALAEIDRLAQQYPALAESAKALRQQVLGVNQAVGEFGIAAENTINGTAVEGFQSQAKAAKETASALSDAQQTALAAADGFAATAKAAIELLEATKGTAQFDSARLESTKAIAEAMRQERAERTATAAAAAEQARAAREVTIQQAESLGFQRNSVQSAEQYLDKQREIAEEEREQIKRQSELAAAGSFVTDVIRGQARAVAEVSDVASQNFADLTKSLDDAAQASDDLGDRAVAAAVKLADAARAELSEGVFSQITGFYQRRAAEFELASLRQITAAERFFDAYESGNVEAIRRSGLLNRSVDDIRSQFNQLDSARLDRLIGTLDQLDQRAQALADTLEDRVLAATRELASLQGDEVTAQEIDNQERLAEIEALRREAELTGNRELLAQADELERKQREINQLRLDEARARQEAARRTDDSSGAAARTADELGRAADEADRLANNSRAANDNLNRPQAGTNSRLQQIQAQIDAQQQLGALENEQGQARLARIGQEAAADNQLTELKLANQRRIGHASTGGGSGSSDGGGSRRPSTRRNAELSAQNGDQLRSLDRAFVGVSVLRG